MTSHPRRPGGYRDADGVRIVDTSNLRRDVWIGVALGCAGVAVIVALRLVLGSTTKEEPTQPAAARQRDVPAAPARVAAAPPVAGASAPRTAAPSGEDHVPTEKQAEESAMTEPGERTGIAVFPPPGTKPLKQGIVVPEGFELPEGYVRHYQTTDDGRQLPPILMFHPDYVGTDAQGNPVELPADRIVPRDMAPTGMPIEMLDVPEHTGTSIGQAGDVPIARSGSMRHR